MRRFLWTRKLYLSLGDFDCDEIVHIVEIGVPTELNLGANVGHFVIGDYPIDQHQ